MKKQFFYAAFAIAMMASCTSENEPQVDQPTPDAEEKVAIELSVDAPAIAAGSRGTGTVGSVTPAENKWNSQKLGILMVDKDGKEAGEYNDAGELVTPVFASNLEFRAPRSTENKIRIYTNDNVINDYDQDTDKGTIQYVYYPADKYGFKFYGWHVDDAGEAYTDVLGNSVAASLPVVDKTNLAVTGIRIDGTQDILGAQTVELPASQPSQQDDDYYVNNFTGDWSEMITYSFSARTARNGIHPILKFNHQLARLKFFVRAGSNSAASNGKTPQITDTQAADYDISTGAVYIEKIVALGMTQTIDMDLKAAEGPKSSAAASTTYVPFTLMDREENNTKLHELTQLTPKAGQFVIGEAGTPADYVGEPIGEAIMFFPDANAAPISPATLGTDQQIVLSLDLAQWVDNTWDEVTDITTGAIKRQTNKLITLNSAHLKNNSTTNTSKKFLPGESYNVYITIYGMEKIVITAELTPWTDGGNVEADIEKGGSSASTTNP